MVTSEPVFLVGAVDHGLEKSAVLGLGNPVGSNETLSSVWAAYRHDRRKNATRATVNARGKSAGFMIGLRRSFWPMMEALDGRLAPFEEILTTLQIHLKKHFAR